MKVDSKNIIKYLLLKIPVLKNSSGFELEDIDLPYVAFGMFIPFIVDDKKLLNNFLSVISDLYEKTEDDELKNLINIEIFENFHRIGEKNILKHAKMKMNKDFLDYLNSL